MQMSPVRLRREPVTLPTYEPQSPEPLPMFLERRVYQGSSGRVYPLPCVERIAETKTDRVWDALYLENEFLEVMILPELGGRIHAARDKTNGYDFIYRQRVIKPALVGLAGPWASGGIEFNWPQHHRPSTFRPADVAVEEHPDGSKTVWLSEHDPLCRMKGMHGVCLHPGRSVIELKVRAYNRTPLVQTFLWWANVATHVHEGYQSFFPPDVTHVADHARGAISTYPLCTGKYYGIDYAARARTGVPAAERPPAFIPPHCRPGEPLPSALAALEYAPNDLSWYANIPVPTSYMCLGSKYDFFGGYDHLKQAGLVHVADHRISPGKKQWTWGNHPFGYAWDRNLTDDDGPYIELMAGVYTDNQPDFSFLQPGETKTWSQFWYPIREIGPAQNATTEAALGLTVRGRQIRLGVQTTRSEAKATVRLTARGRTLLRKTIPLGPDRAWVGGLALPPRVQETDLCLTLQASDGRELLRYQPEPCDPSRTPQSATEPPLPAAIASTDELYLTGLHLAQYRHPTRRPEPYWQEAVRRDPGDLRCNLALGLEQLRAGDFARAEILFRTAVARATARNPNPADGESHYSLGLALRYRADTAAALGQPSENLLEEAYDAFAKATWNAAWQSAGYFALAELDCRRAAWGLALEHLDRSLRVNADHLKARDLRALVLRRLGRDAEAEALLRETLALDPLDWWARHLLGGDLRCDSQTCLDLAHDYARAGFHHEAITVLERVKPEPTAGMAPLIGYTLAWLRSLKGDRRTAAVARRMARSAPPEFCFPARLEDVFVLGAALAAEPRDARAPYYLGCLLYDRKRHREAIAHWERAARLKPRFASVWRNLGLAYFNILEDPARAGRAYERAVALAPAHARLLFERDRLWRLLGVPVAQRLAALEAKPELVRRRDDLSLEFCELLNQAGRHQEALAYLEARQFQPWEGGEGLALEQHVRTHLALGRRALAAGDATEARRRFEAALTSPPNLGEAKHLLANESPIHYWLGVACAAMGDGRAARRAWETAASFKGDFQEHAVRACSEMTYFSALALEKLGRRREARALLRAVRRYAQALGREEAKVPYFATSLPGSLLFENIQHRQETTALLLEAQATLGLGDQPKARRLLRAVLKRDPSRALAQDLLAELT